MVKKLLVQAVLWYSLMAIILFAAAGTLTWSGAWAFLIEMIVLGIASAYWLYRYDPGLLAERLRSPIQEGQSTTDRAIMGVFLSLWCAWLVAMGLEARWLGIPGEPWGWPQDAGAVLIAASILVVCWTCQANSFAAPVVKLQSDRGHRVATGGPYRWVRHPMYSGSLLMLLGIPMLLGAYWGLVWVPVMAGLLAIRSVLEERFLTSQLEGYRDYAARVRYRLIPTIW